VTTAGRSVSRHSLDGTLDMRNHKCRKLIAPRCCQRLCWQTFTHPFAAIQVDGGLLELDGRGLRCTSRGVRVIDAILPDLMVALEKYGAGGRLADAVHLDV
jgi:hypothetical protein